MAYEVLLLVERATADATAFGDVVPVPTRKELADALGHTRDWDGAAEAVARARSAVRLVEDLPSEERLPALLERVATAAKKLACVAVWWRPAERLIEPRALQAAARAGDPLRVALHVRLFHVEEGPKEERVMDTLGMEDLGLPDVQCHFFGLDVAPIAALLEETARYLYAEGDVIGDEDTVPGIDGAAWACRRETALVEPQRDVIDLTPPGLGAARRKLR